MFIVTQEFVLHFHKDVAPMSFFCGYKLLGWTTLPLVFLRSLYYASISTYILIFKNENAK